MDLNFAVMCESRKVFFFDKLPFIFPKILRNMLYRGSEVRMSMDTKGIQHLVLTICVVTIIFSTICALLKGTMNTFIVL